MKTPKISVAMATYNGEKYIFEQLESLATQTMAPYELVVCDDRSTDATVSIVEDFAKRASFPVRVYVNNENLGYADNFLGAASRCVGDWIAFCDQDDVWLPRKIEVVSKVLREASDTELIWIAHTSLVSDEKLNLTGARWPDIPHNAHKCRLTHYGFFGCVGFSTIFHAKLAKSVDQKLRPRMYWPIFNGPPGHDLWIGILANAMGDMAFVSEPLAIWRRHSRSATGTPTRTSILDGARRSMIATDSEHYIFSGDMAAETSGCFKKIAHSSSDPLISSRALEAAARFQILSENLTLRGALYRKTGHVDRAAICWKLIYRNAYFGRAFHSLGAKSFVKDMLFAFGGLYLLRILASAGSPTHD